VLALRTSPKLEMDGGDAPSVSSLESHSQIGLIAGGS
jgi:hypothetical protein